MAVAAKNKKKTLSDGPDWTFELLDQYHTEIKRVAEHYKLDTYVNQIEIITAEQFGVADPGHPFQLINKIDARVVG